VDILNPLRIFWTLHTTLRKAQARFRRRRGLEPTQLPWEGKDGETDVREFWAKYSTTIIGALAAILGISTAGWFTSSGEINWLAVLTGLGFAIFAHFTKPRQLTGGTVPATKEAEARTQGVAALPSTK
jgi:hypothetical protein